MQLKHDNETAGKTSARASRRQTMRFFTHFYLDNHMHFQDYYKFTAIFAALVALLLATSRYLHHRLETKYRDLSIIFLLLIVFLLGVQYTYYTQSQSYANDTSRMVVFLDSVTGAQNVPPESVRVNSVKRAVLKQNGQLSAIQYSEQGLRYPLIIEGQLDTDILELVGKDSDWVAGALDASNIKQQDVYVGEYQDGQLVLHVYEK